MLIDYETRCGADMYRTLWLNTRPFLQRPNAGAGSHLAVVSVSMADHATIFLSSTAVDPMWLSE